ncbi:MAG TPA: prolyl oligopeptidase family serine peptidase [Longimicrobiales bacterium]|nr:prolyl oligopeptidase family serine peptidase [Longimicrobiales bacterium]
MSRSRSPFLALALALVLAPAAVSAQDGSWDPEAILAAEEWVRPPSSVTEAVLAPRYLNASLDQASPDGAWFLHAVGDGPTPMERFSLPFDELGGVFIDRRANRSRNLTTRSDAGLTLISALDGSRVEIEVPEGARVSGAEFSPDGSRVAFFAHFPDATHIYVAEAASGDAERITDTPVLATFVTDLQWTSNGEEIVTVLLPEDRAPRPEEAAVPTGPQVKRTLEGENMLRTYASLMETPHDEALLAWHATGQLAAIDADDGSVTAIGEPAMIWSVDFAPGGEYGRVELLQEPFSYIVPVNNFGRVEEIWDRSGTALAQVSEREMNVGTDGNAPSAPGVGGSEEEAERRQVAWRSDGAGLTFLAKVPGGEDEEGEDEESEGRNGRGDRVMLWVPPFGAADETVVYEHPRALEGYNFAAEQGWLFVREERGDTERQLAVSLADTDQSYTIYEHDTEDFYADPGDLVLADGPMGGRFRSPTGDALVSGDGASVYLSGSVYAEDPLEAAPMNFLDRVDIRTGETERIFQGANQGVYEELTTILDVDQRTWVVSRESPTQVPQYYRIDGGSRVQLTDNVDHTPDLTEAPRRRFTVTRPDGFRFLVNVTLPPGYREGTRLPAMFWFYPREYEDQESYDERGRTFNKNAFPSFGTRSIEYLIRMGYAVVEPDAPIVGDEGRMNNNYENDLRNNLAAVIDELDRRELIDRQRLGIGGHSYGAFGTLNAMVHTPFFKAGIAGDGNYNRTFTPLRFQSERRIFWDAKEVYLGMSPFMYANHLTGAVLLYHGLMDQNVGTAPDHSPRLFHALNGLGKDAAMYLYPFEDHGPATRETLLDLWARWTAWLQVHLGDPTAPDRITEQGDGSS